MNTKKLLAQTLIWALFIQFSFASLSQENNFIQTDYVTNIHKVQIRETPWISGEKTYTVMDWVYGKVLWNEVKKDGLTWTQVQYNQYVTWWVHSKLVQKRNSVFKNWDWVEYTVYFTNTDDYLSLNGEEEVGDTILSSAGTPEQIVWITTDFRTQEPAKVDYPWGKDAIEFIKTQEEETTEKSVVTSVINDFRTATDVKVYYPWNIPEEIIRGMDEDDNFESEVPMIITTNLRVQEPYKVDYPWGKDAVSHIDRTDIEEEKSPVMSITTDLRQETEIKVHYPWVKDFIPSNKQSSEENTFIQEITTMITSSLWKTEAPKVSYPWNIPEDIIQTEDAEEDETTQFIQSITTVLPWEQVDGWTISDILQ